MRFPADFADPFWIVNFYWLFWFGLSFALAVILGFIILRPVIFKKTMPPAVDPWKGWGYQ
jgi:hypothetical protein